MSHRDVASIPLAVAAAANPVWLPSLAQLSSALAICLQVGGLILICVQVAYYMRKK